MNFILTSFFNQRACSVTWAAIGAAMVLLAPWTDAKARTISGLVYPLHDVALSTGVAGLVIQRPIEPGQRVKAGQVLLLLDDRLQFIESERRRVIFEDQSELSSVRERTKILSTLLESSRLVFKQTGSVSKDEVLRLDAEYLASKGRMEQLVEQKKRERLDYEGAQKERFQRHITAPFGGVVTKIVPQVGEWAKPGDSVVYLVEPSTAVLHIAIPHKELGTLKVGSSQNIALEASSHLVRVLGRVTFVSPVADPASGLVEVKIAFSNPQLAIKPGIKGSIELPSKP